MLVESADGTPIEVLVSGAGPPLVLVHGTSGTAERWEGILPALQARFTVYAMNRRGRGESGDTEPYDVEREFADVAAVVDSVGEPVDLFGHSFGALCSLEAALLSDGIRRLVLYEPPIPVGGEIYPAAIVEELTALQADEGPEQVLVGFFERIVRVPPQELDLMRADPMWPRRVAVAHTIPRELAASQDYVFDQGRLESLRVRTEVMMGSESPPFLTNAAKTVRMALPRATLAVLDGQQHIAMDTAPDLFVTTLLDFLGR